MMQNQQCTCLVLTVELLIGNMSRQVCVKDSAEGQSIIPAAAEVGNVDVLWNKQTRQTLYKTLDFALT